MTYRVSRFSNTQNVQEELIAILSTLEYEGFEIIDENTLAAYVQDAAFSAEKLSETLSGYSIFYNVQHNTQFLEEKNWNAIWETNFEPILVGNDCMVRASFHTPTPVKYDLIIDPEMAFGTGHHATTYLMIEYMLNMNFENKHVLDFGCGTGILSILAEKMGAEKIDAIEIDPVACKNAEANFQKNKIKQVSLYSGNEKNIPNKKYDYILANVNAQVLAEVAHILIQRMQNGGILLLSGILEDQKLQMENVLKDLNIIALDTDQRNDWVILTFRKI